MASARKLKVFLGATASTSVSCGVTASASEELASVLLSVTSSVTSTTATGLGSSFAMMSSGVMGSASGSVARHDAQLSSNKPSGVIPSTPAAVSCSSALSEGTSAARGLDSTSSLE